MRLLTDKTKMLVVLINCRQQNKELECGVAIFRGGLSGEIEVSDDSHTFKIKVPHEVAECATHKMFLSKSDNFEIEICAQ